MALQMAALCFRKGKDGIQVLLVTSSNGRWILPKGWPIKGQDDPATALQEAWEEAGVKKGKVTKKAIATYKTVKRFDDGSEMPCKTKVFKVRVKDLVKDYPESDDRNRRWLSPSKAAMLVDDAALGDILLAFKG